MSIVRRSRNYDKLLKFLNARLESPTESIRAEAARTLSTLLMHLDAQKSKREARAIRLRIEKLRTEAIKAQAANAGAQAEEPTRDDLAENNPAFAQALAEYRAVVEKSKKEKL